MILLSVSQGQAETLIMQHKAESIYCRQQAGTDRVGDFFFFFFKQKTAYEISLGLVGSEMCIRDRTTGVSTW